MPVEKTPEGYSANLNRVFSAAQQQYQTAQTEASSANEELSRVKNELTQRTGTWVGRAVKFFSRHLTFMGDFFLQRSQAYGKEFVAQQNLRMRITEIDPGDPEALNIGLKYKHKTVSAITKEAKAALGKIDSLNPEKANLDVLEKDLFADIGGFDSLPILDQEHITGAKAGDDGLDVNPDKMTSSIMRFERNGRVGFAVKAQDKDGNVRIQTFYHDEGGIWKASWIKDKTFVHFRNLPIFKQPGVLREECANPFTELRELLRTGQAQCTRSTGTIFPMKLAFNPDSEYDRALQQKIAEKREGFHTERAFQDVPAIKGLFYDRETFEGIRSLPRSISFDQLDLIDSQVMGKNEAIVRFHDEGGRIGVAIRVKEQDQTGIRYIYQNPENPRQWMLKNQRDEASDEANDAISITNPEGKTIYQYEMEALAKLLQDGSFYYDDGSQVSLEPKHPLSIPFVYPREGTKARQAFALLDDALGDRGPYGKLPEIRERVAAGPRPRPTVEQMKDQTIARFRTTDGDIGIAFLVKDRDEASYVMSLIQGKDGDWNTTGGFEAFHKHPRVIIGGEIQGPDKQNFAALKQLVQTGVATFAYPKSKGRVTTYDVAIVTASFPKAAPVAASTPRPAVAQAAAASPAPAAISPEARGLAHINTLLPELRPFDKLERLQIKAYQMGGRVQIGMDEMGPHAIRSFVDAEGRKGFVVRAKAVLRDDQVAQDISKNDQRLQVFHEIAPGKWITYAAREKTSLIFNPKDKNNEVVIDNGKVVDSVYFGQFRDLIRGGAVVNDVAWVLENREFLP